MQEDTVDQQPEVFPKGAGDWRTAKAYRPGMALTNTLMPVSVVDDISTKTLPPTRSFCSVAQDNVILSALKKADLESSIVLRACEIEGAPVQKLVTFLGATPEFSGLNLLEEEATAQRQTILRSGPYSIRTLKLGASRPERWREWSAP